MLGLRGRSRERVRSRTANLISSGQIAEAVELLGRNGDPNPVRTAGRMQLEQREENFQRAGGPGATEWPPGDAEPLVPAGQLPEVDAADLDPSTLSRGVLGSGALIVRGLVSPERAAELRDSIDRVMLDRDSADGGTGAVSDDSWYQRFDPEMKSFAGPAAVYVCDSPRMALEISQMYQDLGVVDLIEQYLRERPALSLRKWVLRRVPPEANTGWHQDGNFLGVNTRNMNLWIGLSDNGVTAPGLDLVPLRFNELVESGTGDADFDWSVGNEEVARILGEHEAVRPDLSAGDAVFFDHMCLHRTGVEPNMTETRYAIESWFFAPSHFPEDYRGFLL